MPKAINNADAAQALTAAYALKGKVSLLLDEMVVPVSIVDDLTPDLVTRPCGIVINQPAVVAEFGYLIAQTGVDLALEVTHIIIRNNISAVRQFFIRLFTAAEITTISVATATMLVKDIPISGSNVVSTGGSGTDGSNRGQSIIDVLVVANTTLIVPVGATIYGPNLNPARAGIGLQAAAVNQAMVASFVCEERDV